jgi:membrane-associated phospholipid phosphatase
MLQEFDLWLFHLVNAWSGSWTLDRIVGYEEGNNFFKGGLLLIAYWWFWFAGSGESREADRRKIIAVFVGALAALVLNRALSAAFPFRIRPMFAAGIGYRPPSIAFPMNLEDWSSFPSDTATYFCALAFGLFLFSRRLGAAFLAYVAIWMELPRLYLGIHYPSDLIAGAALGVAGVWGAVAARDGVLGRRLAAPMLAAERRHQAAFYAAAFALSYEMAMIFDDVRNVVRGAVRAAKFAGYVAINEGMALFVVGAVVLLAVALGWGAVLTARRWVAARHRDNSAWLSG